MLIEYIFYDLFRFSFPFMIGLVSLIFYLNKKKSGMLIIAVAFFIDSIQTIVFGSSATAYLFEQGLTEYNYAWYATVFGLGFTITFTILMLVGIAVLYKEMT